MAEHNGPRRWLGRQGGLSVSQLLGPPDAEPTPVRGAEPPAVTVTHAEQDRVYLWDQGENIPHGLHHLPREPYVRLDWSHPKAEALNDIELQYHVEFFVTWFRRWCLGQFHGIEWTHEAYVPVSGPGQGTRHSPYEIAVPALLYPARWSNSASWVLSRKVNPPHVVAAPGYYALVNAHGDRQVMAAAVAWQTGHMSASGQKRWTIDHTGSQKWVDSLHRLDGFEPLPPNVEWTMEVPPSDYEHSPPHAIPWLVTFHFNHGTHVHLVYVRVIFARAITEAERRRKAAHEVVARGAQRTQPHMWDGRLAPC